ncbi:MAG: BrnA antitoxin family protein [Phormidesmis sp.]
MKKERFNPIPSELQLEVDALANLPDEQIQTDEIPEVRDWDNAKRGVFYQPSQQQVLISLDADLVACFEARCTQDESYQATINQALREYVAQWQAS